MAGIKNTGLIGEVFALKPVTESSVLVSIRSHLCISTKRLKWVRKSKPRIGYVCYVGLSWCFSCGQAEKKIIPRWKKFFLIFCCRSMCSKKYRYLGKGMNIAVTSVFDDLLNKTVVAYWRRYVW